MEYRVELKFTSLAEVDTVTAHTVGGKSFDLYDEKTWKEVASVSVEGSRRFVSEVTRWAVDSFECGEGVPEPEPIAGDVDTTYAVKEDGCCHE